MSKIYKYNLQLFAGNMNTQTTLLAADNNDLSPEMKVFYSDYLIDYAQPKLVHEQFGQKHPIPKNGGKTIEFRKYSPLPKMMTPLQEGVTPDGQSLNVSTITAEVKQYGGYVTLSDMLLMTAIDNNLIQATKLLGRQAGGTRDALIRNKIHEATNTLYSGDANSPETLTADCKLTVNDIKKAVRELKIMNAEKIGDSYVAIIHPDVSYDLTSDPAWQNVKDYDPQDWYSGEIGRIAGCRFIETTEALIPQTGVYATLILGDNAYGVTEVEGGGLEHIVKQLGSAGTADPINQRATAGWKTTLATEILVDEYIVRILSKSTFNAASNVNG